MATRKTMPAPESDNSAPQEVLAAIEENRAAAESGEPRWRVIGPKAVYGVPTDGTLTGLTADIARALIAAGHITPE